MSGANSFICTNSQDPPGALVPPPAASAKPTLWLFAASQRVKLLRRDHSGVRGVSSSRSDWNVPYEHVQVGQPSSTRLNALLPIIGEGNCAVSYHRVVNFKHARRDWTQRCQAHRQCTLLTTTEKPASYSISTSCFFMSTGRSQVGAGTLAMQNLRHRARWPATSTRWHPSHEPGWRA